MFTSTLTNNEIITAKNISYLLITDVLIIAKKQSKKKLSQNKRQRFAASFARNTSHSLLKEYLVQNAVRFTA